MSVQTITNSETQTNQWDELKAYTQSTGDAYLLKYWVKKISTKQLDEAASFSSLFTKMVKNQFGSTKYFDKPSATNSAADYIQADRRIRDFDLQIFWKDLLQSNPKLELPELNEAEDIRAYLESPESISNIVQVTSISMRGIFDLWPYLFQKYGDSDNFPSLETEAEMHTYLENPINRPLIGKIIANERELILAKTTRLPPEIKHFVNLEELLFSNRKAVVLPKEIYALEKLRSIKVCHSELKKLSKRVGELTNLTELWLFGTKFKTVPESILKLKPNTVVIKNKSAMDLPKVIQSYLFPEENEKKRKALKPLSKNSKRVTGE